MIVIEHKVHCDELVVVDSVQRMNAE
jgi:hypothetical protein